MRNTPLVLLLLVGCGWEETTVPVEIVCTSAISPATFRMVSGTDTTTLQNRYAVPHRMADTVFVGGSQPILVISTHGGRCTTLSDSLIIYSAVKPIP